MKRCFIIRSRTILSKRSSSWRSCAVGIAFLLPHLIGFLAFTLLPLGLCVVMAFSDWAPGEGGAFSLEGVHWIGLANFQRIFRDPLFLQYLKNTLFMMIGIPFGIAGSVAAAVILSRGLEEPQKRVRITLLLTVLLTLAGLFLVLLHLDASVLMLTGFAFFGLILIAGTAGGRNVYRTMFYVPTVTSGVAVYLLWSHLYAPSGPVNRVLGPLLETVTPYLVVLAPACRWIGDALLVGAGLLFLRMLHRKINLWKEGSLGIWSLLAGIAFLVLPLLLAERWCSGPWTALRRWENGLPPVPSSETVLWLHNLLLAFFAAGGLYAFLRLVTGKISKRPAFHQFSDAVVFDGGAMTLEFLLIGLAVALWSLPPVLLESGLDGAAQRVFALSPPEWLTSAAWAKPALMIVSFWSAVGSNAMLLYLAGLAGIPKALYDAAAIDGATPWQKFWYVSWPQLAPVTFLVVVMSVVGALQGGFESARAMTGGGPAGSTTTLVYYLFNQGVLSGEPGYAAAIAWLLFLMVFFITVVYWSFSRRIRGCTFGGFGR